MLLLKQNITRKKRVNKLLKIEPELDVEKNNKYKVEIINNSDIYINKAAEDQLLGLYYLISWKDYLEDGST